jgi:hypothetical protein
MLTAGVILSQEDDKAALQLAASSTTSTTQATRISTMSTMIPPVPLEPQQPFGQFTNKSTHCSVIHTEVTNNIMIYKNTVHPQYYI